MQSAATGSLVQRMIGAARLDVATYEDVEHDTTATTAALTVVVLVAIAGGIGALRDNGIGGLIGGIVSALIGWVVFSFTAYIVGTRLFATATTSSTTGELLRTLGFARTPQLLSIFGFIPVLGVILAFIGAIWALIAEIIALRQALDFTTGRAIATAIVALIADLIVAVIIALIVGGTIYAL